MKLLLNKCPCPYEHLYKVPRRWWMRLFPSRRLYHCRKCNCDVFALKRSIESRAEWHDATIKAFIRKTLSKRRGASKIPK